MNSPAVPHQQINDNHQVALTAATLEAWGGKSVTWGKKHAGHTYQEVEVTSSGFWLVYRFPQRRHA